MMFDWGKMFDVEPEVFQDPVVREHIGHLTRELSHYWKQNVNKYFSKSESYRTILSQSNHRFVVGLIKGHTGGLQRAIRVNWDPKFGTVHVDVGEARNPLTHKDYIVYLAKGTPTTPGKYVLARDIRYHEGERAGTSNEAWRAWSEDFLSEVNAQVRICAGKIAPRAAQIVAHRISGEEIELE